LGDRVSVGDPPLHGGLEADRDGDREEEAERRGGGDEAVN
jgi:hypothetical protein